MKWFKWVAAAVELLTVIVEAVGKIFKKEDKEPKPEE